MIKVQINLNDSDMYIISTERSKLDAFDIAREIANVSLVSSFSSLFMTEYDDGGVTFDIHFDVSYDDYSSRKLISLSSDDIAAINLGDIVRLPIW